MAEGGGASPPDSGGLLQQILSLRLIPRVGNATNPACVAALCHFTGWAVAVADLSTEDLLLPADFPIDFVESRPEVSRSSLHDPQALLNDEMWYGIFLWALVSSLFFHIPAGLLALFTLRRHRYGRFMPVSIFLMGLVGPLAAGTLTSAAIAGVYRAAGKKMIPFEALTWGVGQTFCVVIISFLRILATL